MSHIFMRFCEFAAIFGRRVLPVAVLMLAMSACSSDATGPTEVEVEVPANYLITVDAGEYELRIPLGGQVHLFVWTEVLGQADERAMASLEIEVTNPSITSPFLAQSTASWQSSGAHPLWSRYDLFRLSGNKLGRTKIIARHPFDRQQFVVIEVEVYY